MRQVRNIFEGESYRGTGERVISTAGVVTIILSVISAIGGIYLIANFGRITAEIAIWMAEFLASGFLLVLFVVLIIYFILKLKWKMYRAFWRW